MSLNNEKTSAPQFYLVDVIARGGQGAVYRGVDEGGNDVAVKEMLEQFSSADERREGLARFHAEARLLQTLQHPHIPRVLATFEDSGRSYVVMEFVPGEDLDRLVTRDGAQPEGRVLGWAAQICDVLSYLHRQTPAIIFRDMKPANVVANGPSLKVVDFGIARTVRPGKVTQIGTIGYAPPEQYMGFTSPASDIYALGATLHHLLTGRDPETAKEAPLFPPVRQLNPAVSERTERAIARALELNPVDRFPSVDAFAEALGITLPATSASTAAPASTPSIIPPARPQPASGKAAPEALWARAAELRDQGLTYEAIALQLGVSPTTARTWSLRGAQQAVSSRGVPLTISPAATPVIQPPVAPRVPVAGSHQPTPSYLSIVAFLIALAMLGLSLANMVSQLGKVNAPAPTPVTLISQAFDAPDLEIILPGGDVSETRLAEGFQAAYLQRAREAFQVEVQIQPGSLVYLDGPPTHVADDPRGPRFRASVRGIVLVPQRSP